MQFQRKNEYIVSSEKDGLTSFMVVVVVALVREETKVDSDPNVPRRRWHPPAAPVLLVQVDGDLLHTVGEQIHCRRH
jgi:hypothetical protein